MQRLFAIAKLTLKAALRYRLVQVLTVLLLGAVIGLPVIIKHDGTAQGFTQILLTYTLGAITTLLGFATLWLACGTLARDVEECQMQMVAVKPIARWEIWAGKWTGIVFLNLLLLAVSGVAVYVLMQWRAGPVLPGKQQQLRNENLVGRGSLPPPVRPAAVEARLEQPSLAAETFHEFPLPPNLLDENGALYIGFLNFNNTDLLFPLDEGIEVLYPESGFGLNFLRGLAIIACWLSLLAAIGLASASFLSFPVAAFVSLGVLIVGLSSGTVRQVVEEGGIAAINHETGRVGNPRFIDLVALPIFKGLLKVINLVHGFSPIDSLSTGRSVSWGELARAVAQIVVLMGGVFAAIGIISFTRRELATAQGQQ